MVSSVGWRLRQVEQVTVKHQTENQLNNTCHRLKTVKYQLDMLHTPVE